MYYRKAIPIVMLAMMLILMFTSCEVFAAEDTDYTSQYDAWFNVFSKAYNIPDGLLKAVSIHESGLNPDIIGCTNDLGLMQLNPKYIEYYLHKMGWDSEWDWQQPFNNIQMGAFILRQNYEVLGNWTEALSAYNQGVTGHRENGTRWEYVNKIEWEDQK